MLKRIENLYLKHYLNHQLEELYQADALREFAVSMITIFEPIYLYEVFGSLPVVFLYYATLYLLYFFAVPLGAKAAARHGFEHCISASVIFIILYYGALSQLAGTPALLPLVLLLALADKTLFRMAYHADLAHYSRRGFRGREVGGLSFLESVAGTAGPLLGGSILALFGFQPLFVLVVVLVCVSVLPMLSTQEVFEPRSFSYREAMSNFFHPQENYRRRDSLAYMGYGEELVATSYWPLFIFLSLPTLEVIGFLKSAAAVLVALKKLYLGKLTDRYETAKKQSWVRRNSVLLALSYPLRPFLSSYLGIFAVNLFSDTMKTGIVYPFFTHVYSAGGKNHSFLKYAAFYEMSLALGKAVLGFLIFGLSLYFAGPVFWFIIFLLAGLWSLLYTLLKF